MAIDIEVTPRESEIEDVNLGTSSYTFTYPKVSPLLSAQEKAATITDKVERGQILYDSQNDWLAMGFGPQQWAHIQERLSSQGDPLDFPHIMELFTALFEKAVQSRPPTLRGDSSTLSPPPFHGAVVQKLQESMSGNSPLGVPVT